jgi:hypothetical protein
MRANAWEEIGKALKIKVKRDVSSRDVRIMCPRLNWRLKAAGETNDETSSMWNILHIIGYIQYNILRYINADKREARQLIETKPVGVPIFINIPKFLDMEKEKKCYLYMSDESAEVWIGVGHY